ncbi:CD1375 family protein [Streptococcus agalactiae]|uniref:CD1375 family protein n=2 Tax=Streptococcus agalactiae TaxID=1311 RepID=UPI001C95C152|nr:hypothetical protein [Streptococcus agalactiae]MBY5050022.1 hypothetical protein [Streptococcus agalactiae]MBY5062897.1 hypothetical protein [Streptococcus agalactiae]
MKILLLLVRIFLQEEGIDMMIKLFAINLFNENLTWKEYVACGFSDLINTKVKEQLTLMCDKETLDRILAS